MKKIFLILTAALIFLTPARSSAADVWVDTWDAEEIYVIDESIKNLSECTAFSVSTKKVSGGNVQIINWKFIKVEGEMWRYETNLMSGENLSVVIPRNKIFEFCMENLGWSYIIDDMWYF